MKNSSSTELKTPASEVCEFCNKQLPYRPVRNPFSQKLISWIAPEPCDCPENKARLEKMRQEEEQRLRKEAAAERMRKIEKLFKNSYMGRRFKDRKFETFKVNDFNRAAFKVARQYAENFSQHLQTGEGLLLAGQVGTGKTHLAASIAHHVMANLYTVIFGNITVLLNRIRDTYSSDSIESEQKIIESLLNVDLLVIDDLGKEQTTPWVKEKLYTIINARYEDYKPIVVTTNLKPRELEDKIGEAAWSRIVEMCTGLQMDGPDYRKNKLRR